MERFPFTLYGVRCRWATTIHKYIIISYRSTGCSILYCYIVFLANIQVSGKCPVDWINMRTLNLHIFFVLLRIWQAQSGRTLERASRGRKRKIQKSYFSILYAHSNIGSILYQWHTITYQGKTHENCSNEMFSFIPLQPNWTKLN